MNKICEVCGKPFYVKPCHYEERFCCSKQCQSISFQYKMKGSKNPNFRGKDYSKICQYCGKVYLWKNPYRSGKYCSTLCAQKASVKPKHLLHKGSARFYGIEPEKAYSDYIYYYKPCVTNQIILQLSPLHAFIKKHSCRYCNSEFHSRNTKAVFCSHECNKNWRKSLIGENNGNWKGGIKTENSKVRASDKYKKWIIDVFKRDNYKCQDCGQIGYNLHAHHIQSFSKYPELRLDVNNGKTLCTECHAKYHKNMNYITNRKTFPIYESKH